MGRRRDGERDAAPALERSGLPDRVDRRAMAVLSTGHMLTDTCQGALPALLPFLIAERGFSYAAASLLVLAATLSSSVIQPLFGYYSDRGALPWLMPAGVLTGGIGIGLAGVAGSYGLTFAAILLSGVGVAAYHPEASRWANYVSGPRRASAMSLFSVGGNLGFALGPVLTTPAVLAFGLHGTLVLIIPTALMAVVLASELPHLGSFHPTRRSGPSRPERRDAWGPFARLTALVACRSIVYFGLITFVPLYFIRVLHTSKAGGNGALTVMLLGGALGTLIGGPLADRIGRRAVLLGSMALLPPLILGFAAVDQGWATVLIGVIGAATIATFGITVVLGQELLPNRIGIASGVTMGMAIGLGGICTPLLGLIADAHGLPTTVHVIAGLPILGLLLAITLPRRSDARPGAGARVGPRGERLGAETP